MNEALEEGARVRHPKMGTWGLGQVISLSSQTATIFFEGVGEKKIRTDLIDLINVSGEEAESGTLDNRFRKKRTPTRAFKGSQYFNDGKGTSRKKFIESLGGTCANWNWSWSFVNHKEKKVFYGAWQDHTKANEALILSEKWKTKYGKNRPSWPESRENLRLVEEEGYSLYVYTMILDPNSEPVYEKGARKIGAILNDLSPASLVRKGGEWYAVFSVEHPVT